MSSPEARTENAEQSRVILLVRSAGDEGVVSRVRTELRANGWRILELHIEERGGNVPLAELAAEQGAVRAALRFDAAQVRIELWISRPGGAFVESLSSEGDREDDAELALRITEALRAQGLRFAPSPSLSEPNAATASRAETPASAEVPSESPALHSNRPGPDRPAPNPKSPAQGRPASDTKRPTSPAEAAAIWLELGPALSTSPGGLGLGVGGLACARLALPAGLSIALLGLVPLAQNDVTGSEGAARLSTYLAGADMEVRVLSGSNWQFGLGPGLGVTLIAMRGEAVQGYVGANDSVWALAPFARASALLQLSPHWSLSGAVAGGVTFPEVSVAFADRTAARWGRPMLIASIGVDLLAGRLQR